MNAVEIEEAVSALAAAPFDPAEFAYSFLAAFGMKDTTLKRPRTGQSNASDIEGAVLQRNNIHIAVASSQDVGNPHHCLIVYKLHHGRIEKVSYLRFVKSTSSRLSTEFFLQKNFASRSQCFI